MTIIITSIPALLHTALQQRWHILVVNRYQPGARLPSSQAILPVLLPLWWIELASCVIANHHQFRLLQPKVVLINRLA